MNRNGRIAMHDVKAFVKKIMKERNICRWRFQERRVT
jgi:hypothetical protein